MEQKEKKHLEMMAARVRLGIIEATHAAKCGHPGGSLSAADALTYLYFRELNIDPRNPGMEERDRFVLSKGHSAPGLYAALALRGFFPVEDLLTLRKTGSCLKGHPNMNAVPGVDMSTGSLGQGFSVACGMAMGLKQKESRARVYALVGDGELQEGQIWEACMFASHYHLDNLCLLVDNNGLQIDGEVSRVMSPYPIDEKLASFGFYTISVDGHNFDQLEQAFMFARQHKKGPTAIVLKTVKGKGVSFMENLADWHGKAPNLEQYKQATSEIVDRLMRLEAR